ncbi:ExeM/NucH family extracellular endonuclease [Desulfococcaceae bacterium HSG8]|nr:ExeM/NucH family extracellular endonuclease [Desulfococcaceae bacterium HSG8]
MKYKYKTASIKICLLIIITWAFGTEIDIYASDITRIHIIQGNDTDSPLLGQMCTIEAVVVADLQENDELRGFFMQEEDIHADADKTTSEGIFVYDNSFQVDEGDLVRLTGEVYEYEGLTELRNVTGLTVISSAEPFPTPATVELPFSSDTYLERFEGMQVTLPQKLVVSDHYYLGKFGYVTLSDGRLMSPTDIAGPGSDADKLKAINELSRIILDDGSNTVNPDPIIFPYPGLSADNTLRTGSAITGLTGLMSYGYEYYRIHATTAPLFDISANQRTDQPADIHGRIRVAGFNVMNYFNGPDFPTSRGAGTSDESDRQRAKIINAVTAMNADVIGLMEIENDGYGSDSAVRDLTDGLNEAAPSGVTYAFINPDIPQLGSDEIAVGILYKKETVTPVGSAATKSDGAFASGNRQPLAQTFREIATDEQFTVAVNHFKSKGSPCPDDPDQDDGQGYCNKTRTRAATDLTAWLASFPTGTSDPDILIIGDLNAYAMEDPVIAIENAGYTNLVKQETGSDAYSYLYNGEAGCLDHALSGASLTPQVKGVTIWHINADEPQILDYKEEDKTEGQKVSLYSDNPYRSSDHDPVLIGLDLYSESGNADLRNAISALKLLAGADEGGIYPGADVNHDGIIGFEEVIHSLQVIVRLRSPE